MCHGSVWHGVHYSCYSTCVMVCTCWLVCHGVYLLACVSYGVYLLACVSWCVLVCHGVYLLAPGSQESRALYTLSAHALKMCLTSSHYDAL